MVTSIQTLTDAAGLLSTVLVDTAQVYNVGDKVTTGIVVSRALVSTGEPVACLVQTTSLANAVESRTESVYSVKVAQGTVLSAGQAIKVLSCVMEPDLVGKTLLLDKVSQNGLSLIRKAVASDWEIVNQEGKEGL